MSTFNVPKSFTHVILGYKYSMVDKYSMIRNSTILRVTTTKTDSSIEFYKDVVVINHVLNEYIFPNKLVAVTRTENDGLTVITTLNFASNEYVNEFLSDPIIKDFGKAKQAYNQQHNISKKTEAIN